MQAHGVGPTGGIAECAVGEVAAFEIGVDVCLVEERGQLGSLVDDVSDRDTGVWIDLDGVGWVGCGEAMGVVESDKWDVCVDGFVPVR